LIALAALVLGSLLATIPGKSVDMQAAAFALPREYFYTCFQKGERGEVKGMYNVLLTPERTGISINVNFLKFGDREDFHGIVKEGRLASVKRFGPAEAPTWYFLTKAAAGAEGELVVTPAKWKATISLRTKSAAFDNLDCMEQPPVPKVPK
jgi:hypothetical protein